MLFRTHFVFALLIFLISYSLFDNPFLYGLFFLFATLLVDVDSTGSRMGKIFIFRPMQLFLSHRGVFHSLFFGMLSSGLVFVFNFSAGFGFLMGYFLHLLLDCFSLSGVGLFWPFSRKKIAGFVKTGGIFEEIFFVLALLMDVYFVGRIALEIIFSTI